MIQKEKLVQFYFSQYKDSALKLKKKNNDGKRRTSSGSAGWRTR